jgi:hypothetical protein
MERRTTTYRRQASNHNRLDCIEQDRRATVPGRNRISEELEILESISYAEYCGFQERLDALLFWQPRLPKADRF